MKCYGKGLGRYVKRFSWWVLMMMMYVSIRANIQVEAYQAHIIMPNRHEDPHGVTYEGHLLASETYVGGHVEALEAGVFRSDIPTNFKVVPEVMQKVKVPLRNITNATKGSSSMTWMPPWSFRLSRKARSAWMMSPTMRK
jgi:hypothetical protein